MGDSTTSNLYRLASSVKLKRIEMWCPSISTTAITSTTISLEWLSDQGPSTEISDTGNPFTMPHIASSPPRNSLAGFWSLNTINNSESLFKLSLVTGTVIDIWLEMVLVDDFGPISAGVPTGTVAGQVYVRSLDNPGSLAITPVSYATI
jgi:hypothetical protein